MEYKVYGLKLFGDNPVMYIGVTVNIRTRLGNHKRDNRKRVAKKRREWIQDNKENIELIIIQSGLLTLHDAYDAEKNWIKHYREINTDLLNISDGGGGTSGVKKTQEEIERKRLKTIGRVLSKETIDKIKSNRLNKGVKAVNQFDSNNNLIKQWPSISSIKEELNFDTSSISKCCKGKLKHSYGFKWQYATNEMERFNI